MSSNPGINTALLDFCTKLDNGPKGDGSASSLPKRSPEEMQWLKNALASVEHPERKIKRLLKALEGGNLSEDECLEQLGELSDMVEDINWAIEFVLSDGHRIILEFLEDQKLVAKSVGVRRCAAAVVAHASQLNERVQKCFKDLEWQTVLVPMLMKEEDPSVIAALLHACSCLCRDYAPNALLFARANGVETITRFLDATATGARSNEKIVKRVLFFLSYLAQVVHLDVQDVVHRLVVVADSGDEEVQIAAAQTLLSLVAKNCVAVRTALQEEKPAFLSLWRNELYDAEDCRRKLILALNSDLLEG